MNKEEKDKIEKIINEKKQNTVNEIVKGEKKRISKLKEELEKKSDKYIKRYLIYTPNPQQIKVDKIIKEQKEENER